MNPRGVTYNQILEGAQGIEWICAFGMFQNESKGGFVKGPAHSLDRSSSTWDMARISVYMIRHTIFQELSDLYHLPPHAWMGAKWSWITGGMI